MHGYAGIRLAPWVHPVVLFAVAAGALVGGSRLAHVILAGTVSDEEREFWRAAHKATPLTRSAPSTTAVPLKIAYMSQHAWHPGKDGYPIRTMIVAGAGDLKADGVYAETGAVADSAAFQNEQGYWIVPGLDTASSSTLICPALGGAPVYAWSSWRPCALVAGVPPAPTIKVGPTYGFDAGIAAGAAPPAFVLTVTVRRQDGSAMNAASIGFDMSNGAVSGTRKVRADASRIELKAPLDGSRFPGVVPGSHQLRVVVRAADGSPIVSIIRPVDWMPGNWEGSAGTATNCVAP